MNPSNDEDERPDQLQKTLLERTSLPIMTIKKFNPLIIKERATPARMSDVPLLPDLLAKAQITRHASQEPAKAAMEIADIPSIPRDNPNKSVRLTPKTAPEPIPAINGSARSLRKSV